MSHYFVAHLGQEVEESPPGKPPTLIGKVRPALMAGRMGRGFLDAALVGSVVAQGGICSAEAADEFTGHGAIFTPVVGGCESFKGMLWS